MVIMEDLDKVIEERMGSYYLYPGYMDRYLFPVSLQAAVEEADEEDFQDLFPQVPLYHMLLNK